MRHLIKGKPQDNDVAKVDAVQAFRDPVRNMVYPVRSPFFYVRVQASQQKRQAPDAVHFIVKAYIIVRTKQCDDTENTNRPHPSRKLPRPAFAANQIKGDYP